MRGKNQTQFLAIIYLTHFRFVCVVVQSQMHPLLTKWANQQITPEEYRTLMDALPGMARKELAFILSHCRNDALREDAREELISRNLIRKPWENHLTVAAIVLGAIAALVVILQWLEALLP